jgi:chorismate synthase
MSKKKTINHPEVSSSRKVFSVLVEGDSHDPVGGVEGFLHSVSVVDVNVDVENSLKERQKGYSTWNIKRERNCVD